MDHRSSRSGRASKLVVPALLAGALGLFLWRGRAGAVSEARESAPTSTLAAAAGVLPGRPGRISGRVVDGGERPVVGARCELSPGEPTWGFAAGADPSAAAPAAPAAPGAAGELRTDGEGRFDFEAPEGFWRLAVTADGKGRWSADHLRPGDAREVRLLSATRLEVVVRDPAGEPVPEARVALLDDFRRIERPPLATVVADEDGVVILDGIGPGYAYVALLDAPYAYVVLKVKVDGAAPRVRVELEARPGIPLHGRVSAGEGARTPPAPRVRIEALSRGQSLLLELPCDASGAFATEPRFSPGETLRITAQAAGFGEAQAWTMISMGAGADGQEILLVLDAPERHLHGRAVGADGAALAGLDVFVTSTEPLGRGQNALVDGLMQVPQHCERWRRLATTDERGRFRIGGLSARLQYVLAFARGALGPAFVWAPLGPAGEESDLGDVVVPPSGHLWGVLRYEDGAPAAGEHLNAHPELIVSGAEFDTWRPGRWWRPLTVDVREDGFFRFDRLAPGVYDLKLGPALLASEAVVAGRARGPVELRVARAAEKPDGRVFGEVRDAAGTPLDGAFVGLFEPGAGEEAEPAAMTLTDLRGAFDLAVAAGRPYTLRVSDMRGRFVEHVEALASWTSPLRTSVRLLPDATPREPLVVLVLGPDGRPLEGVDLALEPPENRFCGCISFRGKTDENGILAFEPMAPQEHRLLVSDPLGRYQAQDLRAVGPGDYVEVQLHP